MTRTVSETMKLTEIVQRLATDLEDGLSDADAATRLLINRLLHEPSTALKALAAEAAHGPEERRRIERTLLKLFGIERRYGGPARDDAREDDGSDAQS